jgi:hypothetical protein
LKLLEEFNKTKAENKGYVVLLKSGAFYVSLDIWMIHVLFVKTKKKPNMYF